MTSQNSLVFHIVSGPSKFDLMSSLFSGNRSRQTVELKIGAEEIPVTVAISGVQQEDGSGDSWIIQGWIVRSAKNFNVSGYFSTRDRHGSLTIEVPFHYVIEGDEKVKVVRPEDQAAVELYADSLR